MPGPCLSHLLAEPTAPLTSPRTGLAVPSTTDATARPSVHRVFFGISRVQSCRVRDGFLPFKRSISLRCGWGGVSSSSIRNMAAATETEPSSSVTAAITLRGDCMAYAAKTVKSQNTTTITSSFGMRVLVQSRTVPLCRVGWAIRAALYNKQLYEGGPGQTCDGDPFGGPVALRCNGSRSNPVDSPNFSVHLMVVRSPFAGWLVRVDHC